MFKKKKKNVLRRLSSAKGEEEMKQRVTAGIENQQHWLKRKLWRDTKPHD